MKRSLLLVVLLAYNVRGSLIEERKRSNPPSYSVAELCKLYNLGTLPGHYRVSPSDESVPISTYVNDGGLNSGVPILGTPAIANTLTLGPYQPSLFGSQPPYPPLYPGLMPRVGFNSAGSTPIFGAPSPVIVPAVPAYFQPRPMVPQLVPPVPSALPSFLPPQTGAGFNSFPLRPLNVQPINAVSPFSYPGGFNSFPGRYEVSTYQPTYFNQGGMMQQSPPGKSFQVVQSIPGRPLMTIPHEAPGKSSPKEGAGQGAQGGHGQPHWNSLFSEAVMEKLAPFLSHPRNTGVSSNAFENTPPMSNCIPISSLRIPPRCPTGFKLSSSNCACAPDLDASGTGFNTLGAERKL